MPKRPKVSTALRRQVMLLDGHRCAYCRSPMVIGIPMVVEHIVPIIAGGLTVLDNLCLSCYRCNEFKGARQTAPDPDDGQDILLFHPRRQRWTEHFTWDEGHIIVRG
jgi:5-methylcytosine-specific restriction endonuclease McrA